ncbi:hypothetical protein [Salinarimonas chemoclinalis]|uniref:hypothetical protein n=1 Tax=Salinarimonas chemoclinalis TaxID=3241599 RepID=UPI003557C192
MKRARGTIKGRIGLLLYWTGLACTVAFLVLASTALIGAADMGAGLVLGGLAVGSYQFARIALRLREDEP